MVRTTGVVEVVGTMVSVGSSMEVEISIEVVVGVGVGVDDEEDDGVADGTIDEVDSSHGQ